MRRPSGGKWAAIHDLCLSGSRQGAWFSTSERSAARLAHRSGGPGVGSSNLPAPTISPIRFQRLAREAEPRPICEMGMKRTQKVPRWRKKSRDNPELCCRVVRVRRKTGSICYWAGSFGFRSWAIAAGTWDRIRCPASLRQYDVSDPFNPKLAGKVRISGIVSRASHLDGW